MGVSLRCVNLKKTLFLIRVHFAPSHPKKKKKSNQKCEGGRIEGEDGRRAEGRRKGELDPNEKCSPCRAESNVWQQRSSRS